MSNARLIRWIMLLYPLTWRARYGEELAGLVEDMGDRVTWQVRVDLIVAGVRERARTVLALGRLPDPDRQARRGILWVLWAWVAFVPAGVLVQKTSEHWQTATGSGSRVASLAFDTLADAAVVATALILLAVAATLPALRTALRDGAWPRMRARVIVAGAMTVALALATAGLVAWAHGLTDAQRNGSDGTYTAGFVVWAILGIAVLAAWAALAGRVTTVVPLAGALRRLHSRLAVLVAAGMVVMAVATVVWYATIAAQSPAALTGQGVGNPGSPFVGRLIGAMVVMAIAAAVAVAGAHRAATPPPDRPVAAN